MTIEFKDLPIRHCVNCNKIFTDFKYAARNAFDPRETICPECMFSIIRDLQAKTRNLPISTYHMNEMADYRIWEVYQEEELLLGLVIADSAEQAINAICYKHNIYYCTENMFAVQTDPMLFIQGDEKEYREVEPTAIIGCLKKDNLI